MSLKPVDAPIGVFDSGLGGLTVLMACVRRLPDQPFLYFGDHANAPYGPRNQDEIYELTRAGVAKMFALGCRLVILACNTASAVALRRLQMEWVPEDRRVLGVFVPMIEALSGREWGDNSPPRDVNVKKVLLFATEATISSGAFQRELRFRACNVAVHGQACPELVPALEEGRRDKAQDLARSYVAQACEQMAGADAAVLGCTHYPIVEASFAQTLPAGCKLLSQPDIVAQSLKNYLERHPHFKGEPGGVEYLTSGKADEVRRGARIFMGVEHGFQPV